MEAPKQKTGGKTSDEILEDYKDRNKFLAKEVAKWKVNYHDVLRERNKLHEENLNLIQQMNRYMHRLSAVREYSKMLNEALMKNGDILTSLLLVTDTTYQVQQVQVQSESCTPKKVDGSTVNNSTAENSVVNNNSNRSVENSSEESSDGNEESGNSEKLKVNKSNSQELKNLTKSLSTIIEENASNVTMDEESQRIMTMLCKEVVVQLSPCKAIEERLSGGRYSLNKKSPSETINNDKDNENVSSHSWGIEDNILRNKNVVRRRGGYSKNVSPDSPNSPAPTSSRTGTPSLSSTIANFTDTFEKDTEQVSMSTTITSPMRKSNRMLLSSTPYDFNKSKEYNTARKSSTSSPLKNKLVKKKKLNLENISPTIQISPTKSKRSTRNARPSSLKEASLRKKLRRN